MAVVRRLICVVSLQVHWAATSPFSVLRALAAQNRNDGDGLIICLYFFFQLFKVNVDICQSHYPFKFANAYLAASPA